MARQERQQLVQELARPLQGQVVAGVRDDVAAGARDQPGQVARGLGGDHAGVGAVQDQRRDADAAGLIAEVQGEELPRHLDQRLVGDAEGIPRQLAPVFGREVTGIAPHVQPPDDEPPLDRQLGHDLDEAGPAHEVVHEAEPAGQVSAAVDGPLEAQLLHPLRVSVGEGQRDRAPDRHARQVEAVDLHLVGQAAHELRVGIDGRDVGQCAATAEARQVRRDRVIAGAQLRHQVVEHPGGRADPAVEQDEGLRPGREGDGFTEEYAAAVDLQRTAAVGEASRR